MFVGSGVHREIIGAGWGRSPLASWETLLSATAQQAGLPRGVACHKSLTAAWDSMVSCELCNGYQNAAGSLVRPRNSGITDLEHEALFRNWQIPGGLHPDLMPLELRGIRAAGGVGRPGACRP